MLYYQEATRRRGAWLGAAAVAAYLGLWLALMLLLSFKTNREERAEAIEIEFGDTQAAAAVEAPAVDPQARPQQVEAASGNTSEQLLTQDTEPAPVVSQQQPRQVDSRALFPSRSAETAATPSETARPTATVSGTGGTSFDLEGRSVAGSLPYPAYEANEQGRVVIRVTVDPAGNVVSAGYQARGSSTNNRELVAAAEKAALASKFNAIEGDNLQTGTITYNFRLR